MKKCFICLEEIRDNYVKLCSCEESYIHLRECYENFRYNEEIRCPICKKILIIEERFYYDWFYLYCLIKKIFFILYVPFILVIFPILYSTIFAQNKSIHFSIFFTFIIGNIFILAFYYNLCKNKYSTVFPNDNLIETNSKRILEEDSISKKLKCFFKYFIIYYSLMEFIGIVIDKSVSYNFPSFIILITCIFTIPLIHITYKFFYYLVLFVIPYLIQSFCLNIGVLKRKPHIITSSFEN